jgi:hypothetical protein
MSECTERSEGREQTTPAGDVVPDQEPPPVRSGRRADSPGAARQHRPPNALGPFIPGGTE